MDKQNQIDQQRRVITDFKMHVTNLMVVGGTLRGLLYTHERLNMGTPESEAFIGTGTDAATYLQAIWALNQIRDMPDQVLIALEAFCR